MAAIFLATCSNMSESTHVLGAFASEAAARAFLASPHDEASCPRTWAYGVFGANSEASAALLTGVGAPRPADAEENQTSHELEVVRVPLMGGRAAGAAHAFIVYLHSVHIGPCFSAPISRAISTKAAALAYMRLPGTSALPTRGSGVSSPLDERFEGEGGVLCRAYPVTGWP